MKIFFFISFLVITSLTSYAQAINLEYWASQIVDSLKKEGIDTIEYYHSYCGECIITRTPTDTLPPHQCDVGNGFEQIQNRIEYKQKGYYFTLTFNCAYPPIKKEMNTVKSIPYFMSIVPILIKRNRYVEAMQRKRKFNPPIIVDGGYEEAVLYFGKLILRVFMKDDEKTDRAWRSYFWIDKQTKLLSLLESETLAKN